MAQYRVLGMGGTFDHFHIGHQAFLRFAANLADVIVVGITEPALTTGKVWSSTIESYQERYRAVAEFCHREHIKAELVPLHDGYGPTLEGSSVEALCVTAETLPGAAAINRQRQQLGLTELPVHTCPFVLDETGQPLHADRIRAGLVDRTGRSYAAFLHQLHQLTAGQRQQLATLPPGATPVNAALTATAPVTVVGDTSLETFITAKWPYHLGVFDRRRRRQDWSSPIIDSLPVSAQAPNPAGQLSPELGQTLLKLLAPWHAGEWRVTDQPLHLFIEGEEDLATVALALILPLGSYVCYGQPDLALMTVPVTEALKDHFTTLLSTE